MDRKGDPIAIVGVGCRFPGADNLEEFWRVLSKGENHIVEVPRDRWNVDAWYDHDNPGKTYARHIGVIKGHDEFDNRLYGISETEAEKMDPQQRFVLEAVHMALEDGGFTRDQLNGSKTGVYVGFMNLDYQAVTMDDLQLADNYSLTGTASSIIAARVSYVYNLHGPAIALDTACSSALTAIHLASQGLSTGDCDLAVAGGVNCILLHSMMIPLSKARMISRLGQCQAFSEEADGYVRGEGCGIVILKRLSDALKDKDKIWAIITTGSNQDGSMADPITAPSGRQQIALLEETYSKPNIDPSSVQYIEAHGTGTPIGDPTEVNSLGEFFGRDRKIRYIGSVKTNIGHLESAAGVAGVIKVLLMMRHGTIVPSLHSSKLNKKIDFQGYHFQVPTKCVLWEELPNGGRSACVNSFGFGGSNSHAYIQQYTGDKRASTEPLNSKQHKIISLSSHTTTGLRANILHLKQVAEGQDLDLQALSYTSTCRRDHRSFRLAIHAKNKEEIIDQLTQASSVEFVLPDKRPKVIFVFGGMGTAWEGMCRELLETEDVFRVSLERVDEELAKCNSISVVNALKTISNIHDPAIEPLIIFACQIGLSAIWRHWGVEADAVIGQSVGEVAAAYVAGILSLASAVKVIFHRTRLLCTATGGEMLLVGNCPVSEVEKLCLERKDSVRVAVYNSPISCVISGETEGVASVKKHLETLDIPQLVLRELPVKTAFHSHKQLPLAKPLSDALHGLKSVPPKVNIISSVTGYPATDEDFRTADYWAKNLTDPVLFHQGLVHANDDSRFNVFLEIGPRPVTRVHFKNIFDSSAGIVLPSMDKHTEINCLLKTLCELYRLGFNPAWRVITEQSISEPTEEPRYQFQKKKALFEPEISKVRRQGMETSIGRYSYVMRVTGSSPTFEISLNQTDTPFVFSHIVGGSAIVPGAFFTDVAFTVGTQLLEVPAQELCVSVRFLKPVFVKERKRQKLTLVAEVQSDRTVLYSIKNGKSVCVYGGVNKITKTVEVPLFDVAAARSTCTTVTTKDEIYLKLKQAGFEYGESLQLVTRCEANRKECLAHLKVSSVVENQMRKTHLHPSILDAALQSAIGGKTETRSEQRIPSSLGQVTIYRQPPGDMLCFSTLTESTPEESHFNLLLMTLTGQIIAEVKDFVTKALGQQKNVVDMEYYLTWKPFETVEKTNHKGCTLFISRDPAVCEKVRCYCDFSVVDCYSSTQEPGNSSELNDKLRHWFADQGFSGIAICPTVEEEKLGRDTLSNATELFLHLKEIITFLKENDIDIPLTVITLMSQNPPVFSEDLGLRLYGSPVWGMMRCVFKEINRKIQLLDLTDFTQSSFKTLKDCVNSFNLGEIYYREVLISHGTSFQSVVASSHHIAPLTERNLPKRKLSGPISFKSSGDLSTLKMEYNTHLDETQISEDLAKVRAEQVVVHKPEFYPERLIPGAKRRHAWPEPSTLISLETCGFIGENMSGDSVIALHPTRVGNIVLVPRSSLISLSLLPDYKPGLLMLLVLIHSVTTVIRKRSVVCIIAETINCPVGNLVALVLTSLGFKQTSVHAEKFTSEVSSATTDVILASNCDTENLLCKNQFQKVKKIIAIKGTQGEYAFTRVPLSRADVQLRLQTPVEVFQPGQVCVALKDLSKILTVQGELFRQKLSKITEYHLTGFVKDVLDLSRQELFEISLRKETLFRKNAAYVIVGGFTGLGWLLVRIIAEMGGGLVVAVSRRTPDQETQKAMKEIEQETGATITYVQADVCDMSSLERGFNWLQKTYDGKSIRGIFNGAAVLEDSLLENATAEKFERVANPKLKGSLNLHLISQSMDLDFFMLHSSVTSIFGNVGQVSYGAANSFLDTLAHYRRATGQPGQSVNWGPLAIGMALRNEQTMSYLKGLGYIPLDEASIRACFVQALLSDDPQICFLDFDWQRTSQNPRDVEDIRQMVGYPGRNNSSRDNPGDMDEDLTCLQDMTDMQRKERLLQYVVKLCNRAFPLLPEVIQHETSLEALGLNSMVAMTIVNQIQNDLGVRLSPIRLLGDDLTLDLLAEDIANELSMVWTENSQDDNNYGGIYVLLSPKLSPQQLFVYRTHAESNDNTGEVEVTELKMNVSLTTGMLRRVLNQIIENHRSLRTIYRKDGDSAEPIILNQYRPAEVLEIISDDEDDVNEQVLSFCKRAFNLETDLPFRLAYVRSGANQRIVFAFHPISFDQKAINIFFMEFKNLLLNEDVPTVLEPDIAKEVFRVLAPDFKRLRRFWQKRLNPSKRFSPLTLSMTAVSGYVPFAIEQTVTLEVDADVFKDVLRTVKRLRITVFQFLLTAYQILWYLLSGEVAIGHLIAVDTRQHVPNLINVITRCVNYIPVVTVIDQNASLEAFLKTNSEEVSLIVQNGLYPGFLALANISEESTASISRHIIIMEDLTDEHNMLEGYIHKVGKAGLLGTRHETRLLLWVSEKRQILKLQLDYHPNLVSKELAEAFLLKYKTMIEFIMKNSTKTVGDIVDNIFLYPTELTTTVEDLERQLKAHHRSQNGSFSLLEDTSVRIFQDGALAAVCEGTYFYMKSESKWCLWPWQRVHLRAQSQNGLIENIVIGVNRNYTQKRLPLSDVSKIIHSIDGKFHVLTIQTNSGGFKLRTRNKEDADTWMAGFRYLLNPPLISESTHFLY